jgi:hypothetical protein
LRALLYGSKWLWANEAAAILLSYKLSEELEDK